MHNLCFNRTEFILIDESECSVYMNGLMCTFICHKLQIDLDLNRNIFFSDMRTLLKYSSLCMLIMTPTTSGSSI